MYSANVNLIPWHESVVQAVLLRCDYNNLHPDVWPAKKILRRRRGIPNNYDLCANVTTLCMKIQMNTV